MSEFSWSFHIRTADPAAVEKLLGTAKFSGLVFGPANGWLTFVPYADVHGTEPTTEPMKFSAKLLKATGLPVLAYSYVEDEYWSFALVQTGKPPCWFSCAWEPDPMVERDGLDLSAFDGICAGASIESFLREPSESNLLLPVRSEGHGPQWRCDCRRRPVENIAGGMAWRRLRAELGGSETSGDSPAPCASRRPCSTRSAPGCR